MTLEELTSMLHQLSDEDFAVIAEYVEGLVDPNPPTPRGVLQRLLAECEEELNAV